MRHLPVHWYEGMFLRPHHFQAADRWLEEQLALAGMWDHPHGYGFFSVGCDEEGLTNGVLRLTKYAARLKDGAIVVSDKAWACEEPLLNRALAAAPEGATLYLAVPHWARDEGNLSVGEAWRRYDLTPLMVPDENLPAASSGRPDHGATKRTSPDEKLPGNPHEIKFRRLDARPLFSFELSKGCECLPLVRIMRVAGSAGLHLDPSFVPPLLRCDAWPEFKRGFAVAVHERLRMKARELAARVTDPLLSSTAPDPGNLGRVLLLGAVNRAECRFAALAQATGVHPWSLYMELCQLVGDLALFDVNRYAPPIPAYNHDDLWACFKPLKESLLRVLSTPLGTQAPPGQPRMEINLPSGR